MIPGSASPLLLTSADSGYEIERSLRFNDADQSNLSRTPSSIGNRKTFTWSGWTKRSELGGTQRLMFVGPGSNYFSISFNNDQIQVEESGGSNSFYVYTNAVFRDPSAWYHVVIAVDTLQATQTNRVKVYVNGTDQPLTAGNNWPPQNADLQINNTVDHRIGRNDADCFNGFLADVHFIDGQALAPTDFGETDDNGVWQPKEFAGTYNTSAVDYTSQAVLTGTIYSGAGGVDKIFDGTTATCGPNQNSYVTFTPSTPIPINSSFRIRANVSNASGNAVFAINGSDVSTVSTGFPTAGGIVSAASTWTTITGYTQLTSLKFGWVNHWMSVSGIEIDGVELLDSVAGVNGFHLDFADNSSNAALGTDTSGISPANTWTVNNLTATTLTLPGVLTDITSGFLSLASSSDFAYGTGDFTWEFYVKRPTGGGYVIDHGSNGGVVQVISGAKMGYYNGSTGTGGALYQTGFGDVPVNVWTHLAVVRQSGTTYLYKNGTQTASQGDNHNYGQQSVRIGQYGGGGNNYWGGTISNVRIVKNTAVYTSNFTRPATPLANISNTTLLCCQSSSSASAATVTPGTITVNGTVTPGQYSDDASGVDSLVDTPTNGETASDTGLGNQITGNYATWNPLVQSSSTFSNGNLQATTSGGSGYPLDMANFYTPAGTGKWYWEFELSALSGSNYTMVGMLPGDSDYVQGASDTPHLHGGISVYVGYNGDVNAASGAATAGTATATFAVGDILGWAFDAENGTLQCYKNGVSQGTQFTNIRTDIGWVFCVTDYDNSATATYVINFGQHAFANANVPSGYKSLNTANLPEPTIADGSLYFDTKLYTGNGSTQSVTGYNFSPDFVWLKSRNQTYNHYLLDQIRGAGKVLHSNNTDATQNQSDTLTSFNSDGFSLDSRTGVNSNNNTFVGWAWDAAESTTTVAAGDLNSSVYNQSQNWTSGWVSEATYNNGDTFDGILGANGQGGSNYLVWSPASAVSYSDALGGVEVYTSTNNAGYNNWAYKVNPTSTSYSASAPSDLSSFISPYEINSGVQSGWTKISTGDGSLTSVGMWNKYATESGIYMNGLKVNGKILVDSGVTPPNVPSIASTVRANPSAGFSIVKWTGTGSSSTVGHGLSAAPAFIILKNLTDVQNWYVYSASLGAGKTLSLNITDAAYSDVGMWGGVEPTSSVFTAYSYALNNRDYVAYCFSSVDQYSSVGSYTGNGSADGPFVFTGFRPAFILTKRTDSAKNWFIFDSARNEYNVGGYHLIPNLSNVEGTSTDVDYLSNGFKIRNTGGSGNASGGTYIYAAFAEHPFKTARAR